MSAHPRPRQFPTTAHRALGWIATTLATVATLALTLAGPVSAQQGALPLIDTSATPATRSTTTPPVLGGRDDEEPDTLAVSIDELTPQVLTTEDSVTISGTVTNTAQATQSAPTIFVSVQPSTPVSAEQLQIFWSGHSSPGWRAAQTQMASSLDPGQSSPFTVTIARADLPLGDPWEWGPRGVTVSAVSDVGSGRDRTLLIWDSEVEVAPTRIAALVPWATDAPAAVRNALLGLAATPGVTLAVDPALVHTPMPSPSPSSSSSPSASPSPSPSSSPTSSASPGTSHQSGGASPSSMTNAAATSDGSGDLLPATGSAPTTSATFMRQVLSRTSEVVALPMWDADLGALALADTPALLELAMSSREDLHTWATDDLDVFTNVVWPTSATYGRQVLSAFSTQTLIAPSNALTPTEELTFTPVARVEVDQATGATSQAGPTSTTVTTLSSHDALTQVLGWTTATPADSLKAEQTLSALGAIITREMPSQSRTLFAPIPRGTTIDHGLADRIDALVDQPWVSPMSFSDVVGSEPTDIERTTVGDAPALDAATTQAFSAITSVLASTSGLENALEDPSMLHNELERDALQVLGAGLSPESRAMRVEQLQGDVAELLASVRVEPSVTINLINKTGAFPFRVTNDLPWPVNVRLTLIPSDPRLRVTSAPVTTIPGTTTVPVEVPVTAIGSGDILVNLRVLSPSGQVLDDDQTVTVRMRAGWEDAITLGFALVLGLALVMGIIRTVRRRRTAQAHTAGTGPLGAAGPIGSDTPSDHTAPTDPTPPTPQEER